MSTIDRKSNASQSGRYSAHRGFRPAISIQSPHLVGRGFVVQERELTPIAYTLAEEEAVLEQLRMLGYVT
jgi:hypothetical protein